MAEFEFPSQIKEVGVAVFYKCKSLSAIRIPSQIEEIGSDMFNGCSSLREIEFEGKVEAIGDGAFRKCTSLKSFSMPNSVKSVGKDAFAGCSLLSNLALSENLETVEEYAFSGLVSLKEMALPKNLKSVGKFAFDGCSRLQSVVIPESVEQIYDNAFRGCVSLFNVQIKDGKSSLDLGNNGESKGLFGDCPLNEVYVGRDLSYKDNGVGPFSNTENLKKITIGENVKEINKYEFANCAEVKSLRLPDSLTKIGQYAFEGCGMKTIDIPKSVQNIGDGAFSGCVNVSSLNLAEGVVSIGDYAFSGCVNLSEVNSMNVNVPKCKGAAVFDSNVYLNAELYVPQEALSAYQEADVWKNFLSISGKQFGGAELIYNDLTVAVNGFDLIVNAQEGVAVNVYNVAGQCIYSGANHQVQLPACGVYIVNVGGKVSKILVK